MRCIPVYDFQEHAFKFAEAGLWRGQRHFNRSEARAISFANEEDGIVAVFVYHNFDPVGNVIEISGYSSKRDWCDKRNLHAIFEYPFCQIGVRLVVARHSEHNKRVRRIWSALGAKEHIIPELRGHGEAEVIATLLRTDWEKSKFSGLTHEQTKTSRAA